MSDQQAGQVFWLAAPRAFSRSLPGDRNGLPALYGGPMRSAAAKHALCGAQEGERPSPGHTATGLCGIPTRFPFNRGAGLALRSRTAATAKVAISREPRCGGEEEYALPDSIRPAIMQKRTRDDTAAIREDAKATRHDAKEGCDKAKDGCEKSQNALFYKNRPM